jgi:MscS family membrane protein
VRIFDVIATEVVASMGRRQRASASSVVPLGKRTAKVLVVFIAFLATLHSWGVNISALLAGLGIGGLAVALAAQRTIENLFGGVAITTDQPVLVGDFCRFGDRSGIVEDIGLRSTRVRTLDRTVVTVPNGQFSSLQIENFGKRDKVFFHPTLSIRSDATPGQIRTILDGVRQTLAEQPLIGPDPPRVRLIGLGSYSLDIEIFAYCKTTNYDEFLEVQEDLFLRILDLIAAAGTMLAVPTQLSIASTDPLKEAIRNE